MRINHNIASMNTYRQLSSNTVNNSKSLEKLSSGLRINKAGDDAAGLAISEKMRGQIRGLDQATRNSQDAISLIQTAEGALSETHSILQRMRELAVQSSNDTNTGVDRDSIQTEVDQLASEIDRIASTTEFNTKKLLNGSANVGVTVSGVASTALSNITGTGDTKVSATFTFTAAALATADNIVISTSLTAASSTMTAASSIVINGSSFSFTTSDTVQDVLDTLNNSGLGISAAFTLSTGSITITSGTAGSASALTVTGATASLAVGGSTVTQGVDADFTGESAQYEAVGNKITVMSGDAKGLSFELETAYTSANGSITVDTNGTLSMQIGANKNQTMNIALSDMRASALSVNSIDVTSASNAANAITTIQTAIETVSTERSRLGAYQNRLEHTINNLSASSENLAASESRIRDVDMAKEMMEFTKTNILAQAAQAMLAQANQQPQGVLQLLR